MSKTADEEADRIAQLLDIANEQYRKGDMDQTLLALQETLVTAKRLPTKEQPVICLPDLSG